MKKLGIKERCYSCKYWERDGDTTGFCRFSLPSAGDIETEGRRVGCGNWSLAIKFDRYVNSRLLDRGLISDTMEKIVSEYLTVEDLPDEDFDKLCEDLTAYYFGKIPDYVGKG